MVQFCHDAPGFGMLYAQMWQLFRSRGYLQNAQQAAQVVWQQGLLTKGVYAAAFVFCVCFFFEFFFIEFYYILFKLC